MHIHVAFHDNIMNVLEGPQPSWLQYSGSIYNTRLSERSSLRGASATNLGLPSLLSSTILDRCVLGR